LFLKNKSLYIWGLNDFLLTRIYNFAYEEENQAEEKNRFYTI